MNGKLTIRDLRRFAKDVETISGAVDKAALIRNHAGTGGVNVRNVLSAALTTHGAHGAATPVDIGPEIMNNLTSIEFEAILGMFAGAQDRICSVMARNLDEWYGVQIEGLTPEADDAHL